MAPYVWPRSNFGPLLKKTTFQPPNFTPFCNSVAPFYFDRVNVHLATYLSYVKGGSKVGSQKKVGEKASGSGKDAMNDKILDNNVWK